MFLNHKLKNILKTKIFLKKENLFNYNSFYNS